VGVGFEVGVGVTTLKGTADYSVASNEIHFGLLSDIPFACCFYQPLSLPSMMQAN
jgi:hypothetical protein